LKEQKDLEGLEYKLAISISFFSHIFTDTFFVMVNWYAEELGIEFRVWPFVWPITSRQILDSSKLKEFADDNFKFDENGKKAIQTGRKHCGKRLVSQGRQKVSFCWNGLNVKYKIQIHLHTWFTVPGPYFIFA
jgi:hypothetical protein